MWHSSSDKIINGLANLETRSHHVSALPQLHVDHPFSISCLLAPVQFLHHSLLVTMIVREHMVAAPRRGLTAAAGQQREIEGKVVAMSLCTQITIATEPHHKQNHTHTHTHIHMHACAHDPS